MDFTALRYFSETAELGSVRAASERLHVAPSAISRQIAKIEHELQVPVFDRLANGMVLTPAGEILKSKLDGLVREFVRVRSHIAALHNLQAGTVDIYCFQTAIEGLVAPVLHRFSQRHPNVLFNVTTSSTDETVEALESGVAEIGLIVNPPTREVITRDEVFRDVIVAVIAPDHPLANRETVLLRELSEVPFAQTERRFGLRQQTERLFDRYGFHPRVSCATNSLDLIKAVVRLGQQCALLPRFAVANEVDAGTLRVVLVEEFLKHPLAFCVCTRAGRSLSPAARAFVDAFVEFCRNDRQ
ncbi:MAG: LysR family transcriptional regulator [Acetobacteraceae bacterium]|nr:LysR family transcriptional regulator [Acetobacteraceae bacterium]